MLDPTSLPARRPSARPSTLDPESLEQLYSLLEYAGREAIVDVLRLYVGDAVRRVAELEAALSEDDEDGLRRAAHGLRGCSGSVGAHVLWELCLTLEEDRSEPAPKVAAIRRESDWVVELVHREIGRLQSPALASTG